MFIIKYLERFKYAIIDRHISYITSKLKIKLLGKKLTDDVKKHLSDIQLLGFYSITGHAPEENLKHRLLLLPWDSTWNMFLLITTFLTTCLYLPLVTTLALIMNEEQKILSEHLNEFIKKIFHLSRGRFRIKSFIFGKIMREAVSMESDPCSLLILNIVVVVYTGELMYAMDIVLYIMARQTPFLSKPTISNVNRPGWILGIDLISILPIHFIVRSTPLHNMLSINHCLKFFRIQYELRYFANMLLYTRSILWLEILFWLGCTTTFGSLIAVIIANIVDKKSPKNLSNVVNYIVHHITNAGYYQVPNYITWSYMKLIIGLPFVLVTIFLPICTRAHHIYSDCYKKRVFTYQYDVTKQILDNISSSPFVKRMYNNCYETIWKMCDGYSGYLADTLLPYSPNLFKKHVTPIMWVNIMEDITANFFYHSILFANMDRAVIRALAPEIKCLVYSKDQLLYIKDEQADKMVYIVSGLVQILSSDDEETSVLDMISGTCLGEAALLFPKVAVSTIRCARDCEVQVLTSHSFFKICKKYPKQLRVLHKTILDRIEKGKAYKKKADLARQDQEYYMLDMMWMNHILHKLAGAANRIQARRHQLQNIHLRSFYSEEQLTKIPRMIQYLRLINIAARTLEMENYVFLKTTWPYIIHPDGIMRQLIEIVILLLTLLVALGLPYMCFMWTSTIGIEILQFLITSIWVIDLWIQIHTAVQTEKGLIFEPKLIFRYRLTTIDFIIDIFSCIPLELATIFYASMDHYPKFQLNRAAKLWRFHRMFQRLENNSRLNVIVIRVFKILCFLIYAIYVSAFVMYSLPSKHSDHSYFGNLLPIAVQLCTGISLQANPTNDYSEICLPMMILSWFVINAYTANMIVWFKINRLLIYKTQQRVQSFQVQIPKYRKDILKNLKNYVETQDQYGRNVTIVYKQQFLDNLTRQQMRNISEIHIGPTLRKSPLFAGLGDDNILEICSLTQWRIKPTGDVVLNCGDVTYFLLILLEGICEVVDGQTGKNLGFRSGCVLNALEVLFDEPLCQTVVSVTSCRLIMLDVLKLKRMFESFPPGQRLQQTLDACKDIKEKIHHLQRRDVPLSKFKYFSKWTNKTSFYNINENKKTRLFYIRPFSNLQFFSFVRFLLMTITIRPDGKFLFRWEVFRSICAVLSTVTYINIRFVCDRATKLEYYLLWVLDIACYADIYIRLHVGYYNKQGILIQHPLFTAKNYIYGPFIIDFLTCIPFRFADFLRSKPTSLMMCHLCKVFQLYRYFMLIYIKAVSVTAKIIFFVIPTCTLMFNVITNCSIMIMCNVDDCMKWPSNLDCIEFSMLSRDLVDSGHLYLYNMYVVTSIMTTTGLQGVHYLQHYVFFWCLNVMSSLLFAVFTGFMVSVYHSYDTSFLKYQKLIDNLRNFMHKEDIPMSLQSVVLDYYQRCWDIRKGQNINFIMQPFSISLQKDVLYELFGKKILQYWIIQSDGAAQFVKRVLLHMSQLLILSGHDVLELNDVTPFIYIIVNGSVIVKDEDKKIISKLTAGSMFGNLTDGKESRVHTSYTAFGVLEMLYVPAPKFLEYLKRFENCYEDYKEYQKNSNGLSYVAAINSETNDNLQELTDPKRRVIRHCLIKILYIGMYICIIGTVLNTMIYLYQIAARYENGFYYSIIVMGCNIIYPILFIILHFLKKYALFKVDYGCFEKQHKLLTIIFVVSILPVELIAHMFRNSHNYFYIFISLKSLRFTRILHVNYIHKSYLLQFSQHTAKLRMQTTIVMYILMVLFCTAALSLSGQLQQPNFNLHIDPDLLDTLVGLQKFRFFLKLTEYVSNSVLRLTNIEHQPLSSLNIIVMIASMAVIRLGIILITAELSWIVYDMNLPRLVYKNKVVNLLSFMKRWRCSEQVMERVQNYVEVNWHTTKGEGIPVLFKFAPKFLKRSLTSHCYLDYVRNHAVFGKCANDFQRQLVLHLKLEVHEHGQYILLAGTHNSTMYWVHRGHVLQIMRHHESILSKGDCFAYQEGSREVNNVTYPVSYKAISQVQIMSLERSAWIYLLKHFPEAKEIVKDSHFGPTADIIETLYY